MSKFERYKKKSEAYIYPHKHCKRCGEMVDEGLNYCSVCYQKIKEKKEKKRFRFKSKKKEESEKIDTKEEEEEEEEEED